MSSNGDNNNDDHGINTGRRSEDSLIQRYDTILKESALLTTLAGGVQFLATAEVGMPIGQLGSDDRVGRALHEGSSGCTLQSIGG